MKTILTIGFYLILCTISACQNRHVKSDYYQDGKLENEYEYKTMNHHTYVDGYDKEFYENGQLKFITYYKKGKRDGTYTEYFADGKLKDKSFYIDDKLQGVDTNFYENGKIEAIGNYNQGKQNGEELFYYPDGKLRSYVIKQDDSLMYKKEYDSVMLDTVIWRKVWITSASDSIKLGTKYSADIRFYNEEKYHNVYIQSGISFEKDYVKNFHSVKDFGKLNYFNGYKIEFTLKRPGIYILWGYFDITGEYGTHPYFTHRFVVYP